MELKSVGALHGNYGKNTKPYAYEKLVEIDRSLDDPKYAVILGSKLHAVGLRTYRDGSMGFELRAPSELRQIRWYRDVITHALTNDELGTMSYDAAPLAFAIAPTSLERRLSEVLSESGVVSAESATEIITSTLNRVGLDERVAYPCLAWEEQPFVPKAAHTELANARRVFLDEAAVALADHATGTRDGEEARHALMQAVWRFAESTRLSAYLRESLVGPETATRSRAHTPAPTYLHTSR